MTARIIEWPYHAVDIPRSLRNLADRIEAGELQPVRAVVVLEPDVRDSDADPVDVYGFGRPEGFTNAHTAGTLHLAQLLVLGVL